MLDENGIYEYGHTIKQNRFIAEYPVDFNGTQAAIRAGYSPDSAGQIASELLKKPYIVEGIKVKIDIINSVAGVSAAWALAQRMDILQSSKECKDHSGANTALQAIEKTHLQMADKSELIHSGSIGASSDDDRKIIAEYQRKQLLKNVTD